MKDPRQLRETSWRWPLTASEEAGLREWLAAHPEAREDLELDFALTRSLSRLPDVPLPTNFTARVLQAVELESAIAKRRTSGPWWFSFLPKAAYAAAGILTFIASFNLFRHYEHVRARQMAESVAIISKVESLPSPEALQNFDVINNLPPMPPSADKALLTLLAYSE